VHAVLGVIQRAKAEIQICATPNKIDAPSINQELIKYDERTRNMMGAVARGKGMPSNGALKSSGDLPPAKYLSHDI
jgi:hypothetical protein